MIRKLSCKSHACVDDGAHLLDLFLSGNEFGYGNFALSSLEYLVDAVLGDTGRRSLCVVDYKHRTRNSESVSYHTLFSMNRYISTMFFVFRKN